MFDRYRQMDFHSTASAGASVRVARSQRRVLATLVIAVGVILFLRAPWSQAPLFSLVCIILGICVGIFGLVDDPLDVLSPGKLACLLYGASFAIGPLFLGNMGLGSYSLPYYGFKIPSLIATTATIALIGFVFMAGGYALVRSRSRAHTRSPAVELSISPRQARFMTISGLAVAGVGALCYVVLITKAGGINYFLTYTAGRADIFRGVFGGWFWGMLFVFPGYALVALPLIRRRPWACLAGALGMALAFFPLQGRDLLVAPIFSWLVLFHYGNRRLTWQALTVGVVLLVIASAFLGAFRSTTNAEDRAKTGEFVSGFFADLDRQLLLVVAQNVEQLDAMAVAVRYVEKEREHLGPLVLLTWIEPLDRQLFGNSIDTIESGQVMDNLLMPQHIGWNTAMSPSLPGELYISLGWFGVIVGMFVYGNSLAFLGRWANSRGRSPVLFAAYPFVCYMAIKIIVDGTGQLFRLLVVLFVVFLVSRVAPRGTVER